MTSPCVNPTPWNAPPLEQSFLFPLDVASYLEFPMALTTQRVDVPVIVDESKCLEKCVACIEVCPLDVLVKNPETGKAYMKYDECWFCLPCEKECPTNAITVQIPFMLR
ncbi:MAG: Adenylylsulfate reductase subunit beta [Cyanobacteriota bacterium]|jgi:NAD-dependent dihydropyrimidine dehydrogenase PreA subunit